MQTHRFENVVTFPPQAKYPDTLSVAAPRGMRSDVQRAASISGTTTATFIRDAIAAHVRLVLGDGAND